MRQELQRLPDGRYAHQFSIEGFDSAIPVVCTVEIRGDEVLTLRAPPDGAGRGIAFCYTYAFCAYAIKCITP
jgi:hypothetical protein